MVMVQNTAAKVVTYSCRSIADHTCRIVEESFDGMQLRIDGREVWTRLIGQHNAYNLLAIYTAAVICGATEDEALLQISRLESAKGRLETLRGPKDISVIIDYAHTPDAMENVLRTLREIGPKKNIVCLFGCGGDRDKTKRPEMAAVAEKYSDRIFVVLYRLKGSYQSFGFLLIYRLQVPFAGTLVAGIDVAHVEGCLPCAQRLVCNLDAP